MPEIDKSEHYGRYQKQEDRRANLAMKVAHKALDIPEDDMNIHANRTYTGLGTRGVVAVALASGLLPSLLGAYLLFRQPTTPPPNSEMGPKEFDIHWQFKDGKFGIDKVQPVEAK